MIRRVILAMSDKVCNNNRIYRCICRMQVIIGMQVKVVCQGKLRILPFATAKKLPLKCYTMSYGHD
jgi:hypothetical protein